MKQHVIKVCQTAYYELKRISSVLSYLAEDATKSWLPHVYRLDHIIAIPFGYSTNAECPECRCTSCCQSTTRSTLHTPPTATSLASYF